MAPSLEGVGESELKRYAACWLASEMTTDWETATGIYDPEGKIKVASFKTVTTKAAKKLHGGVAPAKSPKKATASASAGTKRTKATAAATAAVASDESEAAEEPEPKPKKAKTARGKKRADKGAEVDVESDVKTEENAADEEYL